MVWGLSPKHDFLINKRLDLYDGEMSEGWNVYPCVGNWMSEGWMKNGWKQYFKWVKTGFHPYKVNFFLFLFGWVIRLNFFSPFFCCSKLLGEMLYCLWLVKIIGSSPKIFLISQPWYLRGIRRVKNFVSIYPVDKNGETYFFSIKFKVFTLM